MLNRSRKLWLTSLLVSTTALSASALEVDYNNLPELVSQSPRVSVAKARVDANLAREGSLQRSLLPRVEVHGGVESFKKGRDANSTNPYGGVEATLNLYNGGYDSLEDLRRQKQTGIARTGAELTRREQLFAARTAYIENRYWVGLLALLESESEMQKKHQSAAEKRIKAALSTDTDRLDFQLRLQEIAQEKIQTEQRLNETKKNLAVILGTKPQTSMTLASLPMLPKTLPTHLAETPGINPQVETLQQEQESLELAINQEKSWYRPKVEAYTGYRTVSGLDEPGDSKDRREGQVGLRLRVPLYDGGVASSETASLRRQKDAIKLEQEAVQQEVSAQVELTRTNWVSLAEQSETIGKSVKTADQLHNQTLSEYQRGNKSSRDVLDATRRLFEAKKEQLINEQEKYLALARLGQLLGEADMMGEDEMTSMHHKHEEAKAVAGENTPVTAHIMPENDMQVGQEAQFKLHLFQNGKPLTVDEIKEAHTQKVHLLVIDPTLTDYHHLHPKATGKPGEWSFSFNPQMDGGYRVWTDITPASTGKQEYVKTDIGKLKPGKVTKTTNTQATLDGYTYKLAFDMPLSVGQASMGKISITQQDGKPVTDLEPVMGAFAHIVAFGEDGNSILHIHPMGKEPETESDRGGPDLEFHIEPEQAGFIKMFVQVRVQGQDKFIPFGLTIGDKAK